MTTINNIANIISHIRSLTDRSEKTEYLNTLDRDVLSFLGGNIKKDGIAKGIASEISISATSISSMEDIVSAFAMASTQSKRNRKIRIINQIKLSVEDRDLVLTILYGSLKLGLKIPVPTPKFGETLKPMLCGTKAFNLNESIIEEKFDGIRCIATNNNSKISLQSRNGKDLNIPIIRRALATIPSGCTVDGEILDRSGDFQKLDRKGDLIYQIFDIIFINNESIIDLSLIERLSILKNTIIENDYIKISRPLNFESMDKIDEWIIESGAEGVVAKAPASPYQYGNRKSWQKYKLFKDLTATVIDYTEGTGKRAGIMGAVNVIPDGSTIVTKVGSGFTDDDLLQMKSLIDDGKTVRIDCKFQNLTSDGAMRFPIFLRIREIDGKEI